MVYPSCRKIVKLPHTVLLHIPYSCVQIPGHWSKPCKSARECFCLFFSYFVSLSLTLPMLPWHLKLLYIRDLKPYTLVIFALSLWIFFQFKMHLEEEKHPQRCHQHIVAKCVFHTLQNLALSNWHLYAGPVFSLSIPNLSVCIHSPGSFGLCCVECCWSWFIIWLVKMLVLQHYMSNVLRGYVMSEFCTLWHNWWLCWSVLFRSVAGFPVSVHTSAQVPGLFCFVRHTFLFDSILRCWVYSW